MHGEKQHVLYFSESDPRLKEFVIGKALPMSIVDGDGKSFDFAGTAVIKGISITNGRARVAAKELPFVAS